MARYREPQRPRSGSREEPELPEIDLHGLPPGEAIRALALKLHECRVRRASQLIVITGLGHGNRLQQPILRGKVAEWLASPEGQRFGVLGHELCRRGGALLVRLGAVLEPGR